MANRKLLAEIDKTLKKVTEGVEIFESIFEKILIASQNQKEKLEGDLKKEIKKLQRYRDQIKTWASSNDIKDKKSLQDARKLIETQMEKFKAMEKELKTKAYSQAGLNQASKMDPEEIHKDEIRRWISDQTETLETQIDALEAEKESMALSKKGKKNDSAKNDRNEKITYWTERHRFHQNRLEAVLRMIDNGNLKPEQVIAYSNPKVDTIKEDIKYYIEENQDPEFEENEYIYEDLKLEEAEMYGIGANDDSDGDEPAPPAIEKHEEKKGSQDAIEKLPTTPPRNSVTTRKLSKKEEKVAKPQPSPSKPPPAPRAAAPAPVDVPVPPPALRYAAAAAVAIPKPEQAAEVVASASSFDSQSMNSSMPRKPTLEKKTASITSPPLPQGTPTFSPSQVSAFEAQDPIIPLPIPEPVETKMPPALADLVASFDSTKAKAQRPDRSFVNSMVDLSFLNLPDAADSSKLKTYFPKNPYPVPGYYPQTPLSVFSTTPAIFERFDTDTLFFIFYFCPGTFQQHLAAKELKRQSWRFHKLYLTWFQRHEEPSEVNENYEQGTYVYFDYEKSWCQRKKNDFRFEYKFLLDDD